MKDKNDSKLELIITLGVFAALAAAALLCVLIIC